MAITLGALFAQMQGVALPVFSDGKEALLYRFVNRGQCLNLEIHIGEGGHYVRFLFPWFLDLNAAQNRTEFLLKLLELNRTYKILKFGCDPADGEVCVSIEIPLGDGTLEESLMMRCMYLLTQVAVQERDRLMVFQQTSIYPGSGDPQFTRILESLLATPSLPEEEAPDTEREPCEESAHSPHDARE